SVGTVPMRAGMLTVLQVPARRTLGAMTAQEPLSGTVRWPSWPAGGWGAYGRRMWRGTPVHSAGRYRRVRAWQTSRGHEHPAMRSCSASRARASALTVKWGERAVVVGEGWPTGGIRMKLSIDSFRKHDGFVVWTSPLLQDF